MVEDTGRDFRFEQVFQRLQVPVVAFEPDFLLADVREPEDDTQIRGPRARATIDEYATHYANGAIFPPLVVWKGSKKIIDGNTRKAAATKAHVERHSVYIVDPKTTRLARILQGSLNQINGERLTNEEAFETARLMREQGYSAEQIAQLTGRKVETVNATFRALDFDRRAGTLGLPIEGLTKAQRIELAEVQLDEPLRLITPIVASKKVPAGQLKELTKRLDETHSEAEAVQVVEDQLATWEALSTPPKQRVPKVKESGKPVRTAAENLATKIKGAPWDALPEVDYQETMQALRTIVDLIAAVPAR